jgi:hypothetical protein
MLARDPSSGNGSFRGVTSNAFASALLVYSDAMVAGVAAAAGAAAAMRQAILTADAAWEPYARARGMHHSAGRIGWAHAQWPRVDGVFGGVAVALELVGRSGGYHTGALAVPIAAVQGNVEVTREGVIAKISKVFGAQDLIIGDEAFDRAFLVKATSEAAARAVLSARVRNEMLEIGVDRVLYDDGSEHEHVPMVLFEVPVILTEPRLLDRALRAAVEIAQTRLQETPYR